MHSTSIGYQKLLTARANSYENALIPCAIKLIELGSYCGFYLLKVYCFAEFNGNHTIVSMVYSAIGGHAIMAHHVSLEQKTAMLD